MEKSKFVTDKNVTAQFSECELEDNDSLILGGTGGGGRGAVGVVRRLLPEAEPAGPGFTASRRETMTSSRCGGRLLVAAVTRCCADVPRNRGQLGAGVASRRAGAGAASRVVVRIGLCAGGQECGQLVRHAEHRIVAGVQLVPFGVELVGGAALVRLTRIGGAAAPD